MHPTRTSVTAPAPAPAPAPHTHVQAPPEELLGCSVINEEEAACLVPAYALAVSDNRGDIQGPYSGGNAALVGCQTDASLYQNQLELMGEEHKQEEQGEEHKHEEQGEEHKHEEQESENTVPTAEIALWVRADLDNDTSSHNDLGDVHTTRTLTPDELDVELLDTKEDRSCTEESIALLVELVEADLVEDVGEPVACQLSENALSEEGVPHVPAFPAPTAEDGSGNGAHQQREDAVSTMMTQALATPSLVGSSLLRMQEISSQDDRRDENVRPAPVMKISTAEVAEVANPPIVMNVQHGECETCGIATRDDAMPSLVGEEDVHRKDHVEAMILGKRDLQVRLIHLLRGSSGVTRLEAPGTGCYSFIEAETEFKLNAWDILGLATTNAGTKMGAMSLLLPRPLIILICDLAIANPSTYEANGIQHKQAFLADMQRDLLSVVDHVRDHSPRSIVVPFALIPEGVSKSEVDWRRSMATALLEEHVLWRGILMHDEGIVCVHEVDEVVDCIRSHTMSSARAYLGLGLPLSPLETRVRECIHRLRSSRMVITLHFLLTELGGTTDFKEVVEALGDLSRSGDVLFWGSCDCDEDLFSEFVILDRRVVSEALSCLLHIESIKLIKAKRKCGPTMDEFVAILDPEECAPILSSHEVNTIWSWNKVLAECTSERTHAVFEFLKRLFVQKGVLCALNCDRSSASAFFVPGLLFESDVEHGTEWIHRNRAYSTKLSYLWKFPDGTPSNIAERLTILLLEEVYAIWNKSRSRISSRTQTKSLGRFRPSVGRNVDERGSGAFQGPISILDVKCWASSLSIWMACEFNGEKAVEAPMHLHMYFADDRSLVLTSEGFAGGGGCQIWRGCYFGSLFGTFRRSILEWFHTDCLVLCPKCIAQCEPSAASSWKWSNVEHFALMECNLGPCEKKQHWVDSSLVSGIERRIPLLSTDAEIEGSLPQLKQSVVMVGLWFVHRKSIVKIGSGFVADATRGLILTVKHTLFGVQDNGFRLLYHGQSNAKVIVGVIPIDGFDVNNALFRYTAEVVHDDHWNVDACVLRISGRFKEDLDDVRLEGSLRDCAPLGNNLQNENLQQLEIASSFRLGDAVTILGFPQGGEGIFQPGTYVNRSADFAKGYLRMDHPAPTRAAPDPIDVSIPIQNEIVAWCPTIDGHSGCPFLNSDGKVTGLLSSADCFEPQRCYLTHPSALRTLLANAIQSLESD